MKIWTVLYNDDAGVNVDVFNTETEAEQAAQSWISEYQRNYPHIDFDRPWREVADNLYRTLGFMDSVTIQSHEVFPPEMGDPDGYIEAARTLYGSDGQIEIDDNALISTGGDSGAYVQGWLWVYDTDLPSVSGSDD